MTRNDAKVPASTFRSHVDRVGRRVAAVPAPAIVGLVLVALLGSAYLIGRSLLSGGHPRAHPHATVASQAAASGEKAEPSGQPDQSDQMADRVPLSREEAGPFGARMTTGSTQVALTFDDGPDPTWTPLVLQTLRRFQTKATFCLVGEQVQAYPDLVRAIVADGHTVCNHTWDHDFVLGNRPRQALQADLTRTTEAIRAAAPQARVEYFRQPGGNWTDSVVSLAQELGMTSLHWAVDPRDWTAPPAATIAATVSQGTEPGSIVLLHDGGGDRQSTVTALEIVLPDLLDHFRLAALPAEPT